MAFMLVNVRGKQFTLDGKPVVATEPPIPADVVEHKASLKIAALAAAALKAADAAKTSTTQALQAINEAAERTPEPGLVLPPSVIAAVTSAAASVPPKQPEPQQT